MQIHEITKPRVDEGLLDLAKKAAGGVRSAVQGVQQSALGRGASRLAGGVRGAMQGVQQARMQRNTADVAKQAFQVWNQYVQQLKTATPDPARFQTLYQQALAAFVQKNLLKGQSIAQSINRDELNQIIQQITAVAADPRKTAALFPQLVQQSMLAQPDVSTPATTLVKIISTSPPVIQYRTIQYALNNAGEWANQTTGKVPDESFQAFLDSEVRKAGVSI